MENEDRTPAASGEASGRGDAPSVDFDAIFSEADAGRAGADPAAEAESIPARKGKLTVAHLSLLLWLAWRVTNLVRGFGGSFTALQLIALLPMLIPLLLFLRPTKPLRAVVGLLVLALGASAALHVLQYLKPEFGFGAYERATACITGGCRLLLCVAVAVSLFTGKLPKLAEKKPDGKAKLTPALLVYILLMLGAMGLFEMGRSTREQWLAAILLYVGLVGMLGEDFGPAPRYKVPLVAALVGMAAVVALTLTGVLGVATGGSGGYSSKGSSSKPWKDLGVSEREYWKTYQYIQQHGK